jgi:anti-sigma factor RsiW
MNPERREEMISAYLDGELSVDERAQVETWLAESPELRQLHDELKAIGASIQALPRHQLTQDLQGAVLRRAEQSVLAGGAERGLNARDVRPASKTPLWLRGAGWRRLAWPAVAVAAALVVMLFNSEQGPAPREVAQAPKGPTSVAARPDAPPAKLAAEATPQTSAASPAQNATASAKPSAAMSRSSTAPAEAGGAAANAAQSSPVTLELKEDDASSASLETIVYRVSSEFLRDNSLEKMLAKNQIAWTADHPAEPSFGKRFEKRSVPAAADSLSVKSASQHARKVYVLRVSDEQRTRILGELGAKSDQVMKNENLSRGIVGTADERSKSATIAEESLTEAGRGIESDKSAKKVAAIRPLRIVLEAAELAPGAPDEAKP